MWTGGEIRDFTIVNLKNRIKYCVVYYYSEFSCNISLILNIHYLKII